MSRHSFDPEIAGRVGLNAAVIFQNIVFGFRSTKPIAGTFGTGGGLLT